MYVSFVVEHPAQNSEDPEELISSCSSVHLPKGGDFAG